MNTPGYDQRTIWSRPYELDESSYAPRGERITFERWCDCEIARLAKKGVAAEVFTDAFGRIALFVADGVAR